MTQKEIDNFLADTKVYVAGKSKEIQEKLFSFGCSWSPGLKAVLYTDKPFLFIWADKIIGYSDNMDFFTNNPNKEITADEILSLEPDGPTYRPFKNQEECWNEMLKHEPFGWLKRKETQIYEGCYWVNSGNIFGYSFNDAYKELTFADGAPFGIKEE